MTDIKDFILSDFPEKVVSTGKTNCWAVRAVEKSMLKPNGSTNYSWRVCQITPAYYKDGSWIPSKYPIDIPDGKVDDVIAALAECGSFLKDLKNGGSSSAPPLPPSVGGAQPGPTPAPTGGGTNIEGIFILVNNAQYGPYDGGKLSKFASEKKITSSTRAWRAGMSEWTECGKIPELASLFSQQSPPAPPPYPDINEGNASPPDPMGDLFPPAPGIGEDDPF